MAEMKNLIITKFFTILIEYYIFFTKITPQLLITYVIQ